MGMSSLITISIHNAFFLSALGQLNTCTEAFVPEVQELPEHSSKAEAFENYRTSLKALGQVMALYKQLLQRDAAYLKTVQTTFEDRDANMASNVALLQPGQ